jgi:hypothetical protein
MSKPKTISDQKLAKARALVQAVVEPRIQEIVDQLNSVLGHSGIRAGVELTWLFDEVEPASNPQPERTIEDETD